LKKLIGTRRWRRIAFINATLNQRMKKSATTHEPEEMPQHRQRFNTAQRQPARAKKGGQNR
jgi:hypothetical protein